MTTRRQEKVVRVIKEAVSDAIANHLNDPRIEAFVSVTRVEVSADLRMANVYLSLFGAEEASQKRTFAAITHARSRIQSHLGHVMQSKFCPVLHFFKDEQFKKTLETLRLIDETVKDTEKQDIEDVEDEEESSS